MPETDDEYEGWPDPGHFFTLLILLCAGIIAIIIYGLWKSMSG